MRTTPSSGQYLTLDQIHRIVGDLADLLQDSLGPDGKAVMISIRSPRQTMVTKVITMIYYTIILPSVPTSLDTKNYFKRHFPSALRASVLNVPHEIIRKEFSIFSGVAVAKAGPLRAERKCPFPKAVLVPRLTPTF